MMKNARITSKFSGAFFNTRIRFAAATIALTVILGGAAIFFQLGQMKNRAWYDLAIHQLRDTVSVVNVQAYQVAFSSSQTQRMDAVQDLRVSLTLFASQFNEIAASDPDGWEEQRVATLREESPWLFQLVRSPKSAALERLRAEVALEFPESLEDIWEDDSDEEPETKAPGEQERIPDTEASTGQIEALNFELLTLAAQLSNLGAEPDARDLAVSNRIWHLTTERLLPSLDTATNILADARQDALVTLQIIFFAAGIAILAVKGFNVLLIYQPMRHKLVRAQVDLEDQVVKAQSADRAKSNFLANMSHEIRTPINGILGVAQLLDRSKLTSGQRHLIRMLSNSGTSLLQIINDILDFSRIEARKIDLYPEEADIADLLEETVTVLSFQRDNANIVELVTKIQPGLPKGVAVDPGRLRQIITNLVGNALKFTDYGHVLVELSGDARDGLLAATISVSDTGRGIPSAALPTLFDRFTQIDDGDRSVKEGAGLGLSICKHLVGLMGGSIEVDSEVGMGTRFSVHLDLPVTSPDTVNCRLPAELRGAHCLVIDNSAVACGVIVGYLKHWGLSVSAHLDVDDCLGTLLDWKPRGTGHRFLVASEAVLKIAGQAFVKEIETLQENGCHIIILKAPDLQGEGHFWQSMKRVEVLHRPISRTSLFNAIQDVAALSTEKPDGPDRQADPAVSPALNGTPAVPPTSAAADDEPLTLLVDDNEVNRMVASEMLSLLGQKHIVAINGLEALNFFKAKKPDIILMDVSMPVMNGFDATKAIRDLKTKTSSPVIIGMTAYAMAEDRKRCLDSGMDDYISKPISFVDMETLYKKWADPKRQ